MGRVSLHGIPRHLLLAAARLPENAASRTLLERAAPPCPAPTTPPPGIVAQDASTAPEGALRVVLPLPPRELHPNARVHWSKKAKAAKAYREVACLAGWRALAVDSVHANPGVLASPMWEAATVQIVWWAPDKRTRDADGLLSSLKSALDGLAAPTHNGIGAGIIANDSGFSFLPVKMETDRENPRVEIWVWRT